MIYWIKVISFFFIAVVVSIYSRTDAKGQTSTIDFVVDLDGVLIFDRFSNNVPDTKIIYASGVKYRLAEWTGEFLQFLSEIPGARVSFYSSGTRERNLEVLEKILLPNGTKAISITSDKKEPPRIFSRDFWSSHSSVKNLTDLPINIDLNRATLIDDQDGNVPKEQLKNFIQIFSDSVTGNYPETYDIQSGQLSESVIKRIQNELPRVAGLIALALKQSKMKNSDFSDALSALQWQVSPDDTEGLSVAKIKGEAFSTEIYKIGRRLLLLRKRNNCANSILN